MQKKYEQFIHQLHEIDKGAWYERIITNDNLDRIEAEIASHLDSLKLLTENCHLSSDISAEECFDAITNRINYLVREIEINKNRRHKE